MECYEVQSADRFLITTDGPAKLFFLAEQTAEPVLLYATAGASRARVRLPHFPGRAVVELVHDDNTNCEVTHLNYHAGERPDPTPVEIPLHLDRPETFEEQVRRVVQTTLSLQAERQGLPSFEEEDDFDVPDEFEPFDLPTRYEVPDEIPDEYAEPSDTGSDPVSPEPTVASGSGDDVPESVPDKRRDVD